jgi:hypothetical protein
MSFAIVARAGEPPFRIHVVDCPDEVGARLPAFVKLEIDVVSRESGASGAPPESVAFRCEGDAARIDVSLGRATRSSTLDLSKLAPDHRARAMALAAAELFHSMSGEPAEPLPIETTPSILRVPEHAAAPPLVAARPPPAVFAGPLVLLVGRPAAWLAGARLELVYPLGALVAPALTVNGAIGKHQATLANVAVQTASAAAHVYFGTTAGRWRWEMGPGASIGWVHLAGEPSAGALLAGDTVAAAWGGPEIGARVGLVGSPRLAFELGGGIVALPVRGMLDGTQRVYAIDGVWASACAEVGLDL